MAEQAEVVALSEILWKSQLIVAPPLVGHERISEIDMEIRRVFARREKTPCVEFWRFNRI